MGPDPQAAKAKNSPEQPTPLNYADRPEWKAALGIADSGWSGIARHLGAIVSAALEKAGLNGCELTNMLRAKGNRFIEPAYVADYLSGRASFGCLFFQIADDLGITADQIFKQGRPAEAALNSEYLRAYLADTANKDWLAGLLEHKPGEELRTFLREFLSRKRAELIRKPVQSFVVGLGIEPAGFDEGLAQTVREVLGKRKLLPSFSADSDSSQPEAGDNSLTFAADERAAIIAAYVNGKVKEGWSRYFEIEADDTLVLQPAFMRGRAGFTLDVFPSPHKVDMRISGEELEERMSGGPGKRKWAMGLAAWQEAYTKGTFSTIDDTQLISNMCSALEAGVNELCPTREPTPAERYEIHQRWAWAGGGYRAGMHVKGPGEVRRRMQERPDPTGRSTFEEDAFQINSSLTIMLRIFEILPELVAEKKQLEPPAKQFLSPDTRDAGQVTGLSGTA